MRILIAGAGAVGGYFGARLHAAGRDVTFLVRSARAQQLRRDGLRIVSPHGDISLTPKLMESGAIQDPYDLILLAVKSYSLEQTVRDLASAVGPQTMILPVLNGMRHMDVLISRFGDAPIIGGVCLVVTDIDGDGTIVQTAPVQQLIYGELSGAATPRLERLDATMRQAGFDAELSTQIVAMMWQKWVQLASLGALTCLLRGTIGDIVAQPGGVELAQHILDESAAIASACGYPPAASFLAQHAAMLTSPGSRGASSMYRDLRKGASVEVDNILGDFLERGQARGMKSPLLQAAFVNLRIYQAGPR